MALKPAICTQCGGQIEVDDSKEAGICQFCGTAFITEKVIHQYVTQNNFAGATINIQGGVETDNLYKLARRAYELKNLDEALRYYTQIKERNPDDWESVFYCAFLKGDITLSDIKVVYDLILKNESMFEKADKCKIVFDTVLSGIYTYYWNDKNEFTETIKYLDGKNDAMLNSAIGEMIYGYVIRSEDKKEYGDYDARWAASAYHSKSKISLLSYFANKENYKDSLEKSIKYVDENRLGDMDFYIDFFKAASFLDKEIANSILQHQLRRYGDDYKKEKYNKIVATIKEIVPSFIPPKRSSTPEKRKAQSIIFGIVSSIIKIFLFALPVLLDRKFTIFADNLNYHVWLFIRFGTPFISVIIPIKKEDSFVSEHKFLTVVLGVIVTCCYSLIIKLVLSFFN